MGSAGFLIIFAAVNLASGRLTADSRRTKVIALAGAIACLGSLAALVVYAATHIPGQLGVLGGLVITAVIGEAFIRPRRAATRPGRT